MLISLVGIVCILACGLLLSHNRRAISTRTVLSGLVLQIALAVCLLKTAGGISAVAIIAQGVSNLYSYARVGSQFLFGDLGNPMGPWGFIFAVNVLPMIIFFGAFMAVLFWAGIIQSVVQVLAWGVRPLLGTSGAETLCAVANSFLGQTEAPLVIRQYLKNMTKSELFVVMVSGMATISGAILAVFVAMGVPAEHLLAASVMAIPASIVMAKLVVPETENSETACNSVTVQKNSDKLLGAISQGTTDGLQLAVNVAAMLISFLALLALLNGVLGYIYPELSLERIVGIICYPFALFLGFTGTEAFTVAQLLGTKVAINELIAYKNMLDAHLSERTVSIVTYALCGFSNISCIGIQIGGIGALVPEKREWLIELGWYAVITAALANLLSATIVAILI